MKKIIIIFITFILITTTVLMLSYIIWNKHINPSQKSLKNNLHIEVSNCSGPGADIEEINSIKWKDNDLIINTTISPNCEKTRIIGDYEITNENLILKYKTEHMIFESGEAACICPREVIFTINDIIIKEYNVILRHDNTI